MNRVILIGRLTRDPEVPQTGQATWARYTLACDRQFKKDGQPTADFPNCIVFGKGAEFAEKYLHKGMKIAITGRIQTGSYQNKEGKTVYTTDVVVDSQEFVESKSSNGGGSGDNSSTRPTTKQKAVKPDLSEFTVLDGSDENLPFS